jgi:hypothetical protein
MQSSSIRPDAALARFLLDAVRRSGWSSDDFDNWRDVGWSLRCKRASSDLEIAFSSFRAGEWILQVAPQNVPGVLGGLLGRQPGATPEDYACSPFGEQDTRATIP